MNHLNFCQTAQIHEVTNLNISPMKKLSYRDKKKY